MAEKKTLEERYGEEILSDNAALKHYSQCEDCVFRDKTIVNGEECGWKKCFCHIYGRQTVSRMPQLHTSYTPVEPGDKPDDVYKNTGQCDYYEKEKRK